MGFADRLIEAVGKTGTPVCVGLDPVLERIPSDIVRAAARECCDPVTAACRALELFCTGIIETVADIVPVVKVQVAFFERYGSDGIRSLERVVCCAKEQGLIVVADGKRGDIGNTARAYADYFLGNAPSSLAVDALTVNPYLGPESLRPFIEVAEQGDRGLFVLVRTTNPRADRLQGLMTSSGRTVMEEAATMVVELGSDLVGRQGYSSIGAVVAGNQPEDAVKLRRLMPGVLFLVPGYGAQGAGPADIASMVDDNGCGVIVSASRSLIYAGDGSRGVSYVDACRQATQDMIGEIKRYW